MQRLSEDLVADILLRVPVKTLLEIKYVCKLWYSIISNIKRSIDNKNAINHKLLMRSRISKQFLIFDYKNYDDCAADDICMMIPKLNYPPELEVEGDQLLSSFGSCNGLFCQKFRFTQIVIWNPSTGHYIIVGDKYHPQSSCHVVYGFGYDPLSDDYKVVKVVTTSFPNTKVDVFNLKTNSWSTVDKPNYGYKGYLICSGRLNNLLNGSLHWIITKDYESPIVLVAFSLAEEKFLEVPKPDVDSSDKFCDICVFNGRLCLSRMDHVQSSVELWVMKEYMARASWTKVCTVLWESIPNFHKHYKIFSPLCSSRDGDIFLWIGGVGVVKYNMKEKRCTRTIIKLENDASPEVLVHVKSQVSPIFDERDTNQF